MSEKPSEAFNLNLTDDEFLALHAEASAQGLHVNDFIVATLRNHTKMAIDIEASQREDSALTDGPPVVQSPS